MLKLRSLIAGLVLALLPSIAFAASIPLLNGPIEPSQIQATLNGLILQMNSSYGGASQCVTSGASGVTCNGLTGTVTTNSLSTAAATAATYTINDSSVAANSVINCQQQGYSGTYVTNGYPIVMDCVPTAGVITVHIVNTHASNALSGTVVIAFRIEN